MTFSAPGGTHLNADGDTGDLVSVHEFWGDTYIPSRHGTKADAPLLT